jgi:LmbE family N-acetylglucosaminyl deacetylase
VTRVGAGEIAAPPALGGFADYLAAAGSTGAELLLVVAHPDDEAIGFGGHLAGLPQTHIVCLTDGAPRDLRDARAHGFADAAAYAAARRGELAAGLALAGAASGKVEHFGIPDQRAAFELVAMARRLAEVIAARQPRFVLTHPYEGGHPDHDAAAFAVRAACRLAARAGTAPRVAEMASYHLGEAGTVYQRFPPPEGPELVVALAPEAQAVKSRMLACHATQARMLAAFSTERERFRPAPAYDFRALPNGGRLQYETWQLGLGGADWLRLAAAALDVLEPGP